MNVDSNPATCRSLFPIDRNDWPPSLSALTRVIPTYVSRRDRQSEYWPTETSQGCWIVDGEHGRVALGLQVMEMIEHSVASASIGGFWQPLPRRPFTSALA